MSQPIAHLSQWVELSHYAVFLGADTKMRLEKIVHAVDGFEQSSILDIQSIERRQAPEPHIVRGSMDLDANRPFSDGVDMPIRYQVVIEIRDWLREALVFSASDYCAPQA